MSAKNIWAQEIFKKNKKILQKYNKILSYIKKNIKWKNFHKKNVEKLSLFIYKKYTNTYNVRIKYKSIIYDKKGERIWSF